ncbi:MAG: hypothetical protein HY719_08875 [Planctomycetes bacterium]|nr:hypothetical protein [Planctomycetota bacterium]
MRRFLAGLVAGMIFSAAAVAVWLALGAPGVARAAGGALSAASGQKDQSADPSGRAPAPPAGPSAPVAAPGPEGGPHKRGQPARISQEEAEIMAADLDQARSLYIGEKLKTERLAGEMDRLTKEIEGLKRDRAALLKPSVPPGATPPPASNAGDGGK